MSSKLEEDKIFIRSVLLPHQDGLLLRDFEKEFKDMVGKVPYLGNGYSSTLELLRSMPDTATVEQVSGQYWVKCVRNQKTKHLNALVDRQKRPEKGYKTSTGPTLTQPHWAPHSRPGAKAPPKVMAKSSRGESYAWAPSTVGKSATAARERGPTKTAVLAGATDRRASSAQVTLQEGPKQDTHHGAVTNILPKALKANLIELMAGQPDGFSVYKLQSQYEKKFGYEFDFRDHGFLTIVSFCREQPDVFEMTEVERGWYHIRSRGQPPLSVEPPVKVQSELNPPGVSDSTKEKIVQLMRRHRNGLKLDLFSRSYADLQQKYLNPTKHGFQDLKSLLESMTETIRLETMGDEVKVYLCEGLGEPFTGDQDGNGLGGRKTIPQQDLRVELHVVVGEVYNPGLFYIMLRGVQTSVALEELGLQLTSFYVEPQNSDPLRIRDSDELIAGVLCAAPYSKDKEWYRCSVIMRVQESVTYKLFFIDYGTVEVVPIDKIRHLHRQFKQLPAQAFTARLAGIRPKGGGDTWPREASTAFMSIITKSMESGAKGHQAAIKGYRKDPNFLRLSVDLVDMSGDTDCYISRELIRKGLAEADPNARQNDNFHVVSQERMETRKPANPIVNQSPLRTPDCEVTTDAVATLSMVPQPERPGPPPALHRRPPDYAQAPKGFVYPPPSGRFQVASVPPLSSLNTAPPGFSVAAHAPFVPPGQVGVMVPVQQQLLPPSTGRKAVNPSLAKPSGRLHVRVTFQRGVVLLKPVQLPGGNTIHVINASGEPYVVSAEISRFFPRYNQRDLLPRMIVLKRLPHKAAVVDRIDGEDLFEQALCHGVLGFDEGPDQVSEQVLLYRLNDLPDIIASLSSHPDQELVDAVKEEIRKFNPKDEYWSLRLR